MRSKNRSTEILVVHRDRLIRDVLTEALDGIGGLRVTGSTGSSGAAVGMVRERRPQVVLVDEVGLDLRGDGILRALADAATDGGLVLVTDDPDEGLVQAAREGGVEAFATKGGGLCGLVDTVRRVGARHRRRGLRGALATLR